MDDSFLTEDKSTQKHKLPQKRRTLVSDSVVLEPQMSAPRPYPPPFQQPKNTTHLKPSYQSSFFPVREFDSQRPGPAGSGEEDVHWLPAPHLKSLPRLHQAERDSPLPTDIPPLQLNILQWTSSLIPSANMPGTVLAAGMVTPDLPRSFKAVTASFCLHGPSISGYLNGCQLLTAP
ncbi:hypothetical protein P7K49_036586 [Saguinus oedipus]|uniref:Uncharacterized protein n=1 Tax=Saguinus oedipus TaxID=9490 RepID=A0ABQ9TKN2_SAGOE|nr:hypothetical protein P7K49_036586 [Saguinus oedipus]